MRRFLTHANFVRVIVVVAAAVSIIVLFIFVGTEAGVLGLTRAMSHVLFVAGLLLLVVGALWLLWRLPKPIFVLIVLLLVAAPFIFLNDAAGGRPMSVADALSRLYSFLSLLLSFLLCLFPATFGISIVFLVTVALSVYDDSKVQMPRYSTAPMLVVAGCLVLSLSLRYAYSDIVTTYVHDNRMYAVQVSYSLSDPDEMSLFACNRWGFGCAPLVEGRTGLFFGTTPFSIVPNEGADGFVLMRGTETLYTHLYQDEGA